MGYYKLCQNRPSRFHGRVWARDLGIWRKAYVGPSCHMTWHMMTLDIQMWPRGEVPGLGLTDEDVGLLKWVDCEILALMDGDILAQGLIELIG
jgi:hypothetical protein